MKTLFSKHDFGAALVGTLAALPQAVAYGLIAVAPLGPAWAAFGILTSVGSSILFGILSGAFTSNPFLVSGPSASTALVLATGLSTAMARGYDPEQAIQLAFAGVIVAGLLQLIAGVFRLGHVVSYLPVPVLAGFVTASALLVLLSSLPSALGLTGTSLYDIVVHGALAEASLWAIVISGLSLLCNFVFNGRVRFVPAALLGLVVGSAVYHLGVIYGGAAPGPEIGKIDIMALVTTPPLFDAPLPLSVWLQEVDIPLLTGISMGLLSAFSTILTGAAIDEKTGVESDVNKDLRSHGVANGIMGLVGFLPCSGSLSRSVAIIQAGAKTRAANLGTGLVFILFLVLLAPLVAALPLWATAGMLAATAIQAVDQSTLVKIRGIVTRSLPYPRVLIGDVVVTLTVVATGLAINLIAAVGVGLVLAVLLFVLGMGRDPVRRAFTAANIHSKVLRPQAEMRVLEREGHRIAIIEVQGALFFGACARLQSQVRNQLAHGAEFIVLDFRNLTSIDSTGCALLRSIALSCVEAGGRLLISCVERERRVDPSARRRHGENGKTTVLATRAQLRWIWLNLEANDVITRIGAEWIFDDTDTALAACEEILLSRLGHSRTRERRGVIASSDIFKGLPRDKIIALGSYVERHRFQVNDLVFAQGQTGDRAYFLVNGRMDVLLDIPGSVRRRRVSALIEGSLFAEMGLLDGGARSASVIAVEPSACFSINADSFADLQRDMPDVALVLMHNLARQFANRLRLANTMISELER
ncbi:MAG: SLC26A/SulP transporter family protein [Rhodospirillales bacterium]|nr:SLC26A/SulP transporter family protein [Rhodospirillales bacterium]